MVGFNEVIALATSSAFSELPSLATNNIARSMASIDARIVDLTGNRHIGLFRDVIPLSMIAPSPNDQRYWNDIRKMLVMYKNLNSRLVLTLGMPIPDWMRPTANPWHGWCPIPENAAGWTTLKNSISWAFGDFLAAMAHSDPALKNWMESHLYIESFNEFDSLGMVLPNGDCASFRGTPAQAADLQNGVVWVLNYYGLRLQTLMPSVGGNPSFIANYYAEGGTGLPNVHLYLPGNSTPSTGIALFESILSQVRNVLPAHLQNRIFITEAGVSTVQNACTVSTAGAMNELDRAEYYRALLSSSTVKTAAEGLIFWRIYDLPAGKTPAVPCEETFGAVDVNDNYKWSTWVIFDMLHGF